MGNYHPQNDQTMDAPTIIITKSTATILNQQDVQTPAGPMQSSQQPFLQTLQEDVARISGCFLQCVRVISPELP
jgi:hypothetical protein